MHLKENNKEKKCIQAKLHSNLPSIYIDNIRIFPVQAQQTQCGFFSNKWSAAARYLDHKMQLTSIFFQSSHLFNANAIISYQYHSQEKKPKPKFIREPREGCGCNLQPIKA